MKKCSDCNVEMIDDVSIKGQHPFEVGMDGESDIFISIPTNEKGSFLGIKYDKVNEVMCKARICPKCGKVELYVETEEITNE
jgi:hypothetical protein